MTKSELRIEVGKWYWSRSNLPVFILRRHKRKMQGALLREDNKFGRESVVTSWRQNGSYWTFGPYEHDLVRELTPEEISRVTGRG